MDSSRAPSARCHGLRQSAGPCALTACLLALAGCGSSQQAVQTDLFQRELRLQEDEIYRLEDLIEEYQAIIRDYRSEVADLQQELSESRPSSDAEPTAADDADTREPTPADDLPAMIAPSTEEVEAPVSADDLIEMPNDLPTTETVPTPAAEPEDEAPAFTPVGASRSEGAAVRQASSVRFAPPPRPFSPQATASARPLNEAPVSDGSGVKLSVEPRGGAPGELIATVSETLPTALAGFQGAVSLMLVDPTTGDPPLRLARWDFDRSEVANGWRVRPNTDGPQLELAIGLPTAAPVEHPLRLWVRLVDTAGAKRLASTVVVLSGDPPRLSAANAAE